MFRAQDQIWMVWEEKKKIILLFVLAEQVLIWNVLGDLSIIKDMFELQLYSGTNWLLETSSRLSPLIALW